MLKGLRVLEAEGLGPGPFAGMLLADLGADVIVAHRKGRGPTAGMPERSLLDRGKRSIALDLKDPADVETFRALARRADGLIEGFRPGVMERLGLGPDVLCADNPRLVYGRMTGWGQEGPLAKAAGHDLNYLSLSGALWYASPPGAAPLGPPTMLGDIGGGALYLVVGMLAGMLSARTTGQGTVVDAAIYDGSAHMMALLMSLQGAGALSMERGRSLLDGPHWSRTYACACGGYMSVQTVEPHFYRLFLDRMGLADDPAFEPQFDAARWPEQTERLAAIFAERPRDHWAALFEGSDACAAPVLNPEEAEAHPMNAARRSWRRAEGMLQPAPAPRFAGAPDWSPPEIPARDQHGEEIRAELGL